MSVLAIDPGTTESAYVVWDGEKILEFGKVLNQEMLAIVQRRDEPTCMVIEQIRSYGNAMGQSTIDTVWWSGRFYERWEGFAFMMPRAEVKKHLCRNHMAKDGNVIQALVDRFAYGQPNKGKGTKKNPGFFYGVSADVWQAVGLAVAWWDLLSRGGT